MFNSHRFPIEMIAKRTLADFLEIALEQPPCQLMGAGQGELVADQVSYRVSPKELNKTVEIYLHQFERDKDLTLRLNAEQARLLAKSLRRITGLAMRYPKSVAKR